jgi:hypothetical protein
MHSLKLDPDKILNELANKNKIHMTEMIAYSIKNAKCFPTTFSLYNEGVDDYKNVATKFVNDELTVSTCKKEFYVIKIDGDRITVGIRQKRIQRRA